MANAPESSLLFPTPDAASAGVTQAFAMLEGRWKLIILFHLFGSRVLRYSELERAIAGISQKMLTQQLRQLERDGLVKRVVFPEVPPRVEYRLTPWGEALCPALDALLLWTARQPRNETAAENDASPAGERE
ncbi:MAG: helix-turn-helix domain-containing protein [Thermomicrobiales bacterium]